MRKLSLILALSFTGAVISCGGSTSDSGTLTISSHSKYTTRYNKQYIVGEVTNSKAKAQKDVEIVATLYDETGIEMGSESAFTYLDVIPTGGKAGFKIRVSSDITYGNYALQAEGISTTYDAPNLEILNSSSYYEYSSMHITGEVRNNSASSKQYVYIIATLYNDDGTVVGVALGGISISTLSPGGTVPFDFTTQDWEGHTRYELVADGVSIAP